MPREGGDFAESTGKSEKAIQCTEYSALGEIERAEGEGFVRIRRCLGACVFIASFIIRVDVEELKRSKEKIAELTVQLSNVEVSGTPKSEILVNVVDFAFDKTKYTDQLRTESKRNQQLEKKLSELTSEHAQRMSTTETQIAELSEQIGTIEKQR